MKQKEFRDEGQSDVCVRFKLVTIINRSNNNAGLRLDMLDFDNRCIGQVCWRQLLLYQRGVVGTMRQKAGCTIDLLYLGTCCLVRNRYEYVRDSSPFRKKGLREK